MGFIHQTTNVEWFLEEKLLRDIIESNFKSVIAGQWGLIPSTLEAEALGSFEFNTSLV